MCSFSVRVKQTFRTERKIAVILLQLPFPKKRRMLMVSRKPYWMFFSGKFRRPNIRLNKIGELAKAPVGFIFVSSLSMAPGTNVAQIYELADLDGPLLQAADVDHPITYHGGMIAPPTPQLWG